MGELARLQGLGPASEKALKAIGIHTRADLERIGPVQAFLELRAQGAVSLNFLYAMVGALQGRHWADIARSEKDRLLLELDGFQQLKALLQDEGQREI